MLYALALKHILRMLKAIHVLRSICLPGATTSARYSVYAEDVLVLVSSMAENDQVGKKIRVDIRSDSDMGIHAL